MGLAVDIVQPDHVNLDESIIAWLFFPAGHVQSRESMEEIIRFVYEEKLFLLADEVGFLECFHYQVSCISP